MKGFKRTWAAALGVVLALVAGSSGAPVWGAPVAAVQATIYVSPGGSDSSAGTSPDAPVQTLQRAAQLVEGVDSNMTGDIDVVLADGFYRMAAPLELTPADSGTNGHNVVWTAAPGARPIIAGSDQITGWSLYDSAHNIWVAQGPSGIQTRQLYVNGARAGRASGPSPVGLKQTGTGYTASAATMAGWLDPSGKPPAEVEFVYEGGLGAWTEPRCPVASMSGTTIVMAEPCWDNSTRRLVEAPYNRTIDFVGPGNLGAPPSRVENAYQLLTQPGQWYLDIHSSKFYYMPRSGESMASADVEAPVLSPYLLHGQGSATNPIQNIVFNGIQFSYATDMVPSSGQGFSEIQANYQVTGPHGYDQQGLCTFATPTGTCPYGAWTQIESNVSFTYDHNLQFTNDAFVHLGAAGLGLGDGTQGALIQGDVVTDTSGSGIQLGNIDMPLATGADQTLDNTIRDNYVFDTPVEFRGGIGIDIGYAANTSVVHNQLDNLPYSAISIGWGGWPDKVGHPGQANFSHNNDLSYNLIFNLILVLNDGGGIYTNGQTSSSGTYATGETVTGNVIHDLVGQDHGVYDDNGTDWMTVTNNAVWNFGPPPSHPWGYCHADYYAGEGGGVDNQTVENNYLSAPWGTIGMGAHCVIQNNTLITGASGVPTSILANAGLEASYQGLLGWTQAPNPPVGAPCPPTMAAPTNVVGVGGSGQVSWTWNAPPADCGGSASAYAVYVYGADGSARMQESLAPAITVTGLTSRTYYTATITAWDGARWTAWSSWSSWAFSG